MKNNYLTLLGLCLPAITAVAQQKPNIVLIMTDQQRADLCKREGFELDVTPFADKMANEGVWFDRAYTTAPASAPARISFLTGRYPKATHVNSNHNTSDAFFEIDMFSLLRKNGYRTAMIGKNHTYMKPTDADYWSDYNHMGRRKEDRDEKVAEFDKYLGSTAVYANLKPASHPVEMQQPYRMVDDAVKWIEDDRSEKPFMMWLSFAEPHNPYQASEPYYSMFPPEKLPKNRADINSLAIKGERYQLLKEMMELGHPQYFKNLQRLRSIYMGMIRMIDDQIARLVSELQASGKYENTVFVILADHGDYAGEYGLMKKGVGAPDVISRIPMVWFGNGIAKQNRSSAHVSIADIFPTICEMVGVEIPMGVQGRSLNEILAGRPYPKDEFRSVMIEDGYGGQYYTKKDGTDYKKEGALNNNPRFFDELNSWSQSGLRRAIRMGDWKFEYDMLGQGEIYNLKNDPAEIKNLFANPKYAAKRSELLAELLKWEIATEDPLPIPQMRYRFKRFPHNYMFYNR